MSLVPSGGCGNVCLKSYFTYMRERDKILRIELRVRLALFETGLSTPVNYFTDRSKAIICISFVLCLSCFCVCSLLPCGHLKGKN